METVCYPDGIPMILADSRPHTLLGHGNRCSVLLEPYMVSLKIEEMICIIQLRSLLCEVIQSPAGLGAYWLGLRGPGIFHSLSFILLKQVSPIRLHLEEIYCTSNVKGPKSKGPGRHLPSAPNQPVRPTSHTTRPASPPDQPVHP